MGLGMHAGSLTNRGQIATEYLTLVGIALIIIAALAAYSFTTYSQAVTMSQINNTFADLRTGIDTVHSLGNGNTVIVTITLPNNVTQFYTLNNVLHLVTTEITGANENVLPFDYNISNLSGSLPVASGQHTMSITSINGVVDLNEVV